MATAIQHQLSFSFSSELPHTPKDRRLRRYTPLQKALTELLHTLRLTYPGAYSELTAGSRSCVIYGSPLGELTINMSQTADILTGAVPLSPVKFQRSVLNASYSQCAIEHGITCEATALTRGFLTADAAIALADQLLGCGHCDYVAILLGEEFTRRTIHPSAKDDGPLAWAQLLWLRHGQSHAQDIARLESIRYFAVDDPQAGIDRHEEQGDGGSTLCGWTAARHRHVVNHRGEGYASTWQLGAQPQKEEQA